MRGILYIVADVCFRWGFYVAEVREINDIVLRLWLVEELSMRGLSIESNVALCGSIHPFSLILYFSSWDSYAEVAAFISYLNVRWLTYAPL